MQGNGGAGGFGGGGGGGGTLETEITNHQHRATTAGAGGFGGGGGGASRDVRGGWYETHGGNGGFGGGAGVGRTSLGVAGFGGGQAGISSDSDAKYGAGGGGLGAGGAIFAMPGTTLAITDSTFGSTVPSEINQVIAGVLNIADPTKAYGATPGQALGSDLFLGANTTINVDSGTSKLHGSIAGYGTGGAMPTLTKTGSGTLELHGDSVLHDIFHTGGKISVGSARSLGDSNATFHANGSAAGSTLYLATVADADPASDVQLAVGTINIANTILDVDVGGPLKPNLVIEGAINGTSSAYLKMTGVGYLTLENCEHGGNFSGTLIAEKGTLTMNAGTMNSGSGFNLQDLGVDPGATVRVSGFNLRSAAMGGQGDLLLQNGAGLNTGSANLWNGRIFVQGNSSMTFTNGTGRLDVESGGTASLVGTRGFNGTLSGGGSLRLIGGSAITVAKDAAGFSGTVTLVDSSTLALPGGFTGDGKIYGQSPSLPGFLSLGASAGNNLAGTFSKVTLDAATPVSGIGFGVHAGDTLHVNAIEVANGRFQVPSGGVTLGSIAVTATGAKEGTAIFTGNSSIGIGGTGTVELDPGTGKTIALSGLGSSATPFTGTLHAKSGTFGTGGNLAARQVQVEAGATVQLTTGGMVAGHFGGAGTLTATAGGGLSSYTFSDAAALADLKGSVDFGDSNVFLSGGLTTSATVRLGNSASLNLGGDLDAPLHSTAGPAPTIRVSLASGTSARIATRSFDTMAGYALTLDAGRFVVDGDLDKGSLRLTDNATVDAAGSILNLTNPFDPNPGTINFTGVGDRTLNADFLTFQQYAVHTGSTRLTLQGSSFVPLGNTTLGANSELHAAHGSGVSGKTLTATGAAAIFGDFQNNGTVIGPPSGSKDNLVFKDLVTGSGQFTGRISYDGGHNPGAVTATGLPGAPAAASYHVTFVDGNLALGSHNVLTLDVGGTVRGASYDAITVTGALGLDGTLKLVFAPGFDANQFFTFRLLESGSMFGSFSALDLPALSAGYSWDVSQINTTGAISLVPEPSAMMLGGAGWAMLALVQAVRRSKDSPVNGTSAPVFRLRNDS